MLHDSTHDTIRVKLDELIASEPSERKSKLAEKLDPYRDQITKALAKGHTFRSIAGALRYGGVAISPETIRRYVQRCNGTKAKRTTRRTTGSRIATSPAPAATVTTSTIDQPGTQLFSRAPTTIAPHLDNDVRIR